MPFINQEPRPFCKENIESLRSNQIGVYGLFNQNGWVYIGKGDIRQRLLNHFNGDNLSISLALPAHWVGEVTHGDPSLREKELLLECRPHCNIRLG